MTRILKTWFDAVPPLFRWLFVAGLALRLLLVAGMDSVGARIVDEQHYVALGTSLWEGHGFAIDGQLTSLRPPLYPAFIAAVWAVTGPSFQAIRLAQIALSVLLVVVVYDLGRRLYDARVGRLAATMTWLYPGLIFSNLLLLTEVLFALLVTVAALACVVTLERRDSRWALAAGLLLGLAALTRSVVWPFPLVMVVLLASVGAGSLRTRLRDGALIVLGAGIVIAPWAARNTRLQGVPVLVDTIGGINLRMGNYEHTPTWRAWDAVSVSGRESWIVGLPAVPPEGGVWTEGKKERWARAEAVRFMTSHPGLTLKRTLIKVGDFWGLERDFIAGVERGLYTPPPWFTFVAGTATLVSFPVVLFLALAGAGLPARTPLVARLLPLLLIVFVALLHAIVFGHPRYRLPFTPLLTIYAGAAVLALRQQVVAPVPWSVARATTAGFVVLWGGQFFVRDWGFVRQLLAAVTG